jgi:hypothetical protein
MELTLTFVLERDDYKTAVRYMEASEPPKVGALYIKKLAFPDGKYPRELTVVIKAATAKVTKLPTRRKKTA